MNKLLRAVEDYLDDEREYVRFAEREIQVLEQKARDERRQTQRRMIAALYWRAGHYEIESRRPLQTIHMEARMRGAAFAMERTARSMEAACPR